jgi:hypothetical protein
MVEVVLRGVARWWRAMALNIRDLPFVRHHESALTNEH